MYQGALHTSDVVQLSHANTQPLQPVQTEIRNGGRPGYDSFLTLDAQNVVVTAAFPLGEMRHSFTTDGHYPERIALRAYEHSGLKTTATIRPTFSPYAKAALTPLDVPIGTVDTVTGDMTEEFTPFDVRTMGLYLPPPSRRFQQPSPSEVSASLSPSFARPWLQNHSPTSPFDRALVVTVQDTFPQVDGKVEVTVTNNSLDEYYVGALSAMVSVGWEITPGSYDYNLAPGRSAQFEFTATRENEELEEWGILAQTEVNGRTVYDTRSTTPYPIEVTSERRGNEYLVTIRNRGGLPARGNAHLLSSFDIEDNRYRSPITPGSTEFTIPPYQDKRILYTRDTEDLPDWMTAKIFANGTLVYHDVSLIDTTPSN